MYQRNNMPEMRFQTAVLPFVLLLSACGGGGGGGAESAPDGATPPQAETVRAQKSDQPNPEVWAAHREFRNQLGLGLINAQDAYAQGITGKGEIIGFIDTGIDETHPEFQGKDFKLNDRSEVETLDAAQLTHGTAVASIALGARGHGDGLHGVAFDADPAVWSLNLDERYLGINDDVLSRGISALEGVGARIINQSWSYRTTLDLNNPDPQRSFLETGYRETLKKLRQKKAIHVFAAGNAGAANVSVSAAWVQLFPELAGYVVSVAALGQDGRIGVGSNHCGAARDHCLVAPGGASPGAVHNTRVATPGGGYQQGAGTSYAAPYVSGVLALMLQAFGDQLSLPEYTARLFATANKSGIYADRSIYGQGLVDVDAALRPLGDVHIPLPAGGLVAVADTGFEDGELPRQIIERLKREKVIILDELNTPFTSSLIADTERYQSFELTEWLTHGDNKTSPETHPFLNGFAAAQENRAPAFWQLVPVVLRKKNLRDEIPDREGFGFTARRTRRRMRWEVGVIGETSSLLGAGGTGALKLGPSHSAIFGFGRDIEWGETTFSFDINGLVSSSRGRRDSLVRGTEGVLASAFMFGFRRRKASFQIGQPSYFERGRLNLNVPYERIAGGGVRFKQKKINLRSEQRPVEMRLFYGDEAMRFGLRTQKQDGKPISYTIGFTGKF